MKKYVFFFMTMMISIAASAQFGVYQPVIVDRNGNWVNRGTNSNSYNYNNNYQNYNPYNYSTPQRPQQQKKSQIVSVRGYYINNNQWNSVLLKVQVIDEKIYVVGIKRSSTGWSNESIRAYSTELMQKEIKDNFDYYIGDYVYGRIYF